MCVCVCVCVLHMPVIPRPCVCACVQATNNQDMDSIIGLMQRYQVHAAVVHAPAKRSHPSIHTHSPIHIHALSPIHIHAHINPHSPIHLHSPMHMHAHVHKFMEWTYLLAPPPPHPLPLHTSPVLCDLPNRGLCSARNHRADHWTDPGNPLPPRPTHFHLHLHLRSHLCLHLASIPRASTCLHPVCAALTAYATGRQSSRVRCRRHGASAHAYLDQRPLSLTLNHKP